MLFFDLFRPGDQATYLLVFLPRSHLTRSLYQLCFAPICLHHYQNSVDRKGSHCLSAMALWPTLKETDIYSHIFSVYQKQKKKQKGAMRSCHIVSYCTPMMGHMNASKLYVIFCNAFPTMLELFIEVLDISAISDLFGIQHNDEHCFKNAFI